MGVKNFAVLKFDGVRLLLPQPDVASVEIIQNIDEPQVSSGAIGTIVSGHIEWPVFALNAKLKILNRCPAAYKYCAAINFKGEAAFSLACEEVSVMSVDIDDGLISVPRCMRTINCPVESIVLEGHQIMLVSETGALQKFLVPDNSVSVKVAV